MTYLTQRRKGAKLFLFVLIVMMTGCGFHLRGAYELPADMSRTYISSANQNSELVRSLKRVLRSNQLTLVDNPVDAGAVLRIISEARNKRVLSVDSQGRAREYELQYSIKFEVSGKDNGFSLPPQELQLQREFLFDPEDVLGKSSEEADLINDMQQDMVRLIMLRLQAHGQRDQSQRDQGQPGAQAQ
ncbi:MAG TPA: LPS assembly lipoprotein LptE [Gammaproteobacteria bacterium]